MAAATNTNTSPVWLRFFGGLLVFVPAIVFVMSQFYVRIRDSLHGAFGASRSWRRALGHAALSFLVLPVLGTACLLVSLGDASLMIGYLTQPSSIVAVVLGYLFVPLYLVWFARKVGPNEIRHVEWASLDIGL